MGGGESSMHVGNASSKTIRVRVAQEKVNLAEVDATLGATAGSKAPFSLNGSIKTKLDRYLDVTGFARIGPYEALEFALPNGSNNPIYVSVTTADDPQPLVICFNYSPPGNRSVSITPNFTVSVSEKKLDNRVPQILLDSYGMSVSTKTCLPGAAGGGVLSWFNYGDIYKRGVAAISAGGYVGEAVWVTEDGLTYTASMATRTYRQSDIDAKATQLGKPSLRY